MTSYEDDSYPDSWRTPTRAEKDTIDSASGRCQYGYKNCSGKAVMTSGDYACCYNCGRVKAAAGRRF